MCICTSLFLKQTKKYRIGKYRSNQERVCTPIYVLGPYLSVKVKTCLAGEYDKQELKKTKCFGMGGTLYGYKQHFKNAAALLVKTKWKLFTY